MLKGMDISVWNGKGNWDISRSKGIEFAIIRLGSINDTTGVCYLDDLLSYNLEEAKRTKMPFGYFFYTRPKWGSAGQRSFILENLANLPKANIEFAVDVEQPGTSIAQATLFVKDIHIGLNSAGYKSMNYTRQNFWDYNLAPDPLLASKKLWAARWNENLTGPWSDGKYKFRDFTNWGYWQWTASDVNSYSLNYGFPGYPDGSAGIELDYYNGTLEQFKAEYAISDELTTEERLAALEQQVADLQKALDDFTKATDQSIANLEAFEKAVRDL